jgi:hypothetical protein
MNDLEKKWTEWQHNFDSINTVVKEKFQKDVSQIIQKSDFFLDNIKSNIIFQDILNYLGDPEDFPTYEDVFSNEYDKAINDYRKWHINKKDYDLIINKYKNINFKIIKCKNLQEFKTIVNILPLPDKRKQYYIEHEWQHWSKAKEYNLDYYYGLNFTKVPKWENWWFRITPYTSISYPTNISFDKYYKMYEAIISEVDELSDWDKAQLNHNN